MSAHVPGPDHKGTVPAFVGRPRHVHHEPIVPMKDGQPPAFVVVCLTPACGYMHDAHGLDGDDAVQSIAPQHQAGHLLVARTINYAAGWARPGQPLQGIAPSTGPHGLYGA